MTTSRIEKIEEVSNNIVKEDVIYCVSSLVSSVADFDEHGEMFYCLGEDEYMNAATDNNWLTIKDYLQQVKSTRIDISFLQACRNLREVFTMSVKELVNCDDSFVQVCASGNGEIISDGGHYDTWQEICDLDNIDAYEYRCEVLEHWIVSEWLAEKLAEHGESINMDFHGLVVWGRCTSGQHISMDGIIRTIADEVAL